MVENRKDDKMNGNANWDENTAYKVGDHYWIDEPGARGPISVVVEEVNELGQVVKGRGLYLMHFQDPEPREFEVWDTRTRQQ